MIDIRPYRRFYRRNLAPFAGAEDGAICAVSTLSTLSSFAIYLSAFKHYLGTLHFSCLQQHTPESSDCLLEPTQNGVKNIRGGQ